VTEERETGGGEGIYSKQKQRTRWTLSATARRPIPLGAPVLLFPLSGGELVRSPPGVYQVSGSLSSRCIYQQGALETVDAEMLAQVSSTATATRHG
jgi:hypothetical protein